MGRQGESETFEEAAEDFARGWWKLPPIARASLWLVWWALLLVLLMMSGCTAGFTSWALLP